MRQFHMGLLMVAVATASFAVGRSTSGHAPSGSVAFTDAPQAQSMRPNPPEDHLNAAGPALVPMDQASSFHGYLVFPSNQAERARARAEWAPREFAEQDGGVQQAAPVAAEDRRVEERAAREREVAERARARAERARREFAGP